MAGVVLNLLTILLQNVFSAPGSKTLVLCRGFNVYTWIITANTVSGPCDMCQKKPVITLLGCGLIFC